MNVVRSMLSALIPFPRGDGPAQARPSTASTGEDAARSTHSNERRIGEGCSASPSALDSAANVVVQTNTRSNATDDHKHFLVYKASTPTLHQSPSPNKIATILRSFGDICRPNEGHMLALDRRQDEKKGSRTRGAATEGRNETNDRDNVVDYRLDFLRSAGSISALWVDPTNPRNFTVAYHFSSRAHYHGKASWTVADGDWESTTESFTKDFLRTCVFHKGGWDVMMNFLADCEGSKVLWPGEGCYKSALLKMSLKKAGITEYPGIYSIMGQGGKIYYPVLLSDVKHFFEPWYLQRMKRWTFAGKTKYHEIAAGHGGASGTALTYSVPRECVPFQQPEGSHLCKAASFCNAMHLIGKQAQALQLWTSQPLGERTWHDMNMRTQGLLRRGHMFYKCAFDPLAQDAVQPVAGVLAYINGRIGVHVVVIYRGKIYDPELKYALVLCRENLDSLGGKGARFERLEQAHVLQLREVETVALMNVVRKRRHMNTTTGGRKRFCG